MIGAREMDTIHAACCEHFANLLREVADEIQNKERMPYGRKLDELYKQRGMPRA